MKEVSRIVSAQWQNDYVKQNQPILIVDGLQDWPAIGRWSPVFLREKCGPRPTVVQVSHTGKWNYKADGSAFDPKTQYGLPNIPFNFAADWIMSTTETGPKYYISQSNIAQYPELLTDIRFTRPAERSIINLWFWSRGTVTPLHFDFKHNFFGQVYGTKSVTLFNPAETPYLCDSVQGGLFFYLSSIDIEKTNT